MASGTSQVKARRCALPVGQEIKMEIPTEISRFTVTRCLGTEADGILAQAMRRDSSGLPARWTTGDGCFMSGISVLVTIKMFDILLPDFLY
jgi:hypothetical protein